MILKDSHLSSGPDQKNITELMLEFIKMKIVAQERIIMDSCLVPPSTAGTAPMKKQRKKHATTRKQDFASLMFFKNFLSFFFSDAVFSTTFPGCSLLLMARKFFFKTQI
jgi:hypothetical protein